MRELLRYSIVGVAAFLADTGTLVILVNKFCLDYLLAAGIGFSVGLILNYLLALKLVFTSFNVFTVKDFCLVALIAIIGLVLTEAGMYLGVEIIGLHYVVAKMIVAAIVLIWNFGARKKLVYCEKSG